MRAILLKGFGGLDSLVIETLPDPEPEAGHAVIQVKAFGINHAETHMRQGKWAEIATVSGIECAGVVKECPGGEFAPGTKVIAFMGGLGRTINGSYAELTNPPVTNIVPIKTDMPWEELATIPESYATAWTWRPVFSKPNLQKFSSLTISGTRTKQWIPTNPTEKWWFSSSWWCGAAHLRIQIIKIS
jgi:NADPH:quinone reductase